jgi:hypothetical protein
MNDQWIELNGGELLSAQILKEAILLKLELLQHFVYEMFYLL